MLVLWPNVLRKPLGCRSSGMLLHEDQAPGFSSVSSLGGQQPRMRLCRCQRLQGQHTEQPASQAFNVEEG